MPYTYVTDKAMSDFASVLKEKSGIEVPLSFPDGFIKANDLITEKILDDWLEGNENDYIPYFDCSIVNSLAFYAAHFSAIGLINCSIISENAFGGTVQKIYLCTNSVVNLDPNFNTSFGNFTVYVPKSLYSNYLLSYSSMSFLFKEI